MREIPSIVRFGAGIPAALAAALSLAASGCSVTLDTSKLDPLSTPEGYCKVLFDEFLQHLTSCYPATQQWVDTRYAQSASMCDTIAGSKSRGAIVYDESAARAQIDRIRSASCTDDFDDVMYDADSPFVGQIPDGGDCAETFECADANAECKSVDATCPGICMTPGTLGAPCAAGYPPCQVGWYCTSTGTCAPAIPTGGDCSAGGCGTGAYCYYCGASCSTQYQCRPYVTEGGACNYTDRACDPDADRSIFCDDLNSGTCKRGGSLVEGKLCHAGECDAATFCGGSGSPGVCQRKLGYGSQCYYGACMPPLYCVADSVPGTPGTCLPPKQVGEPEGIWVRPASFISEHGMPARWHSSKYWKSSGSEFTFKTIFFIPECSHSSRILGGHFLYAEMDACAAWAHNLPFPISKSVRMTMACFSSIGRSWK